MKRFHTLGMILHSDLKTVKKKTQQNERETLVQLKPDMKEEKGKGRLRMLT